MNWKVILLLVCVAISIATYSKRADRQERERELELGALRLEMQEIDQRFAEATGSSRSWLTGAGCDDFRSPLYPAQKAIEETGKALFTVWLRDVVLIDDKPQLTAEYYNTGECTFAPNIDVQAIVTDEQAIELMTRESGRFDKYLLALDVSATYPQDRGILVTGKLIDITLREPKD
jgi:hypothetical protein